MAINTLTWDTSHGWLGPPPTKTTYRHTVVGDRVEETKEVVVHTFTMGDVEDPDIYIASPISDWQQTDHGSWVMKHGRDPTYHLMSDPINFGHKVIITAYIKPKRWTEYVLRGWYTG